MHIIDGRKIAREIEEEIKKKIMEEDKKIKIVTIVIEGNEESWLFAKLKDKACKRVGIEHEIVGLEGNQSIVEKEIEKYNEDKSVTGINIQLPIPLDFIKLVSKISINKDIEGMHPYNIGNILLGNEEIIPCTPKAILKILEHEKIDVKGKEVVIINHSNIIGKPLAMLMLKRNATVSICHVYTRDITVHTKKAEILITATGVKGLIKEDMINENCVLIDAGIKKEERKVYGDVDKNAFKKAKAVTPVPGGVGPVTIASMLENALILYEKVHK